KGYKWSCAAVARIVQELSHQILARSAFSFYQNRRGFALGDAQREREQPFHRLRCSHDMETPEFDCVGLPAQPALEAEGKSFGFGRLALEHDYGPARAAIGAAQRSNVARYQFLA